MPPSAGAGRDLRRWGRERIRRSLPRLFRSPMPLGFVGVVDENKKKKTCVKRCGTYDPDTRKIKEKKTAITLK
jgi:hypothetical protein